MPFAAISILSLVGSATGRKASVFNSEARQGIPG
jgi:hypothetical protein